MLSSSAAVGAEDLPCLCDFHLNLGGRMVGRGSNQFREEEGNRRRAV